MSEFGPTESHESLEQTPENLLELFNRRQDSALIFLKGGEHGGLNPDVKLEIFANLEKWFQVFEGTEHKPRLQEIVERWGSGYLNYPALKVMAENPEFNQDFINEGEQLLKNYAEDEFNYWLNRARNIARNDPGLLRLEMLLAYYASGGKHVLLILKPEVTRAGILADLGLDEQENLRMAVGNERAQLNWSDNHIPFQEFVKRIVVGSTTSTDAFPGTIRSIVGNKITGRKLIPCAELWEMSNDQWSLDNNLTTSQQVASNLLNAVHVASAGEELELELNLLNQQELERYFELLS